MAIYIASIALSKIEMTTYSETSVLVEQVLSTFPLSEEFDEYYEFPSLLQWIENHEMVVRVKQMSLTVKINAEHWSKEDDSLIKRDSHQATYKRG